MRALTGAVEQVLDNYLENALRIAPPDSDIVISAGRHATFAALRVADRAPGLAPEQRERAFDRFWRGPDPTGEGGTGLGLAIVARLVAASGGHARLEAQPGGGTIAVATFPRSRRAAARLTTATPSSPPGVRREPARRFTPGIAVLGRATQSCSKP